MYRATVERLTRPRCRHDEATACLEIPSHRHIASNDHACYDICSVMRTYWVVEVWILLQVQSARPMFPSQSVRSVRMADDSATGRRATWRFLTINNVDRMKS